MDDGEGEGKVCVREGERGELGGGERAGMRLEEGGNREGGERGGESGEHGEGGRGIEVGRVGEERSGERGGLTACEGRIVVYCHGRVDVEYLGDDHSVGLRIRVDSDVKDALDGDDSRCTRQGAEICSNVARSRLSEEGVVKVARESQLGHQHAKDPTPIVSISVDGRGDVGLTSRDLLDRVRPL